MTGDHNVSLLLRVIDVKSQLIHLADLFEVKLKRLWDNNDIMSPGNEPACDVNWIVMNFWKYIYFHISKDKSKRLLQPHVYLTLRCHCL